jgi:hypothetical protein
MVRHLPFADCSVRLRCQVRHRREATAQLQLRHGSHPRRGGGIKREKAGNNPVATNWRRIGSPPRNAKSKRQDYSRVRSELSKRMYAVQLSSSRDSQLSDQCYTFTNILKPVKLSLAATKRALPINKTTPTQICNRLYLSFSGPRSAPPIGFPTRAAILPQK